MKALLSGDAGTCLRRPPKVSDVDLTAPSDCGNSPRMALVADIITAWASGDDALVHEWLADDARWVLVGAQGPGEASSAVDGEAADDVEAIDVIVPPPFEAVHGEILTVLNHGRLAACDGYLARGAERVDFCHVIRFAGVSRTAKIREIRTYLQPAAGEH